jgi:hypothetical protein
MRKPIRGLASTLPLVLFACSEASLQEDPLGPAELLPAAAEVFTDNIRIPIDLLVFVPCANGGAGEDVLLSGNLHIVTHLTINGNRFVFKDHFQPQGINGLGLSTGDKYQATGVTQDRFGGSFINGQFSETFVNNFRIIGQRRGNNFLVHENFHVTVNANGEVTVVVDNFTTACK